MQNSKAETFIGERKKIQKIHPREIHETLPSSVSKKFQAKEKRKGANGERRGTRVTVFFFERVRTLVSAFHARRRAYARAAHASAQSKILLEGWWSESDATKGGR